MSSARSKAVPERRVAAIPEEDTLADEPFSHRVTKDGAVQILQHGRLAMTVGGRAAGKLAAKLERATGRELQLLLARASGQFKFGNERAGKERPKP